MSDAQIATIARSLAAALIIRARTRLPEDQKHVLDLQTQLCQALQDELDEKEKA